MVDAERRKKLAFHLRQLAIGLTSNDDFESNIADDVTFGWLPEQYYRAKEAKEDDAVIRPMLEFCWNLYSDLENHKLVGKYKLSDRELKLIAGYILFLHTDYEYEDVDVSFTNPLIRFSCKDFLLTILTLGRHYREKRRGQEEIFRSMDKEQTLEYWPFSSRGHFEESLGRPRFLNGSCNTSGNISPS